MSEFRRACLDAPDVGTRPSWYALPWRVPAVAALPGSRLGVGPFTGRMRLSLAFPSRPVHDASKGRQPFTAQTSREGAGSAVL